MSDDFHAASSSGSFNFAKHNKTDFEAFRQFQENMEERYTKVEKERVIKQRIANLAKWDESLPKRWSKASLANVDTPQSKEIQRLIKEQGQESFYLYGGQGTEATYLAYGIIRKFIGSGFTTFSQVKTLSEESMLALAYTGFEGQGKFSKILDPSNKVFLISGVGVKEHYDERRELPLWERLLEHIYSNSLTVIFTSEFAPEEFASSLRDSGANKLLELVEGRTVNLGQVKRATPTGRNLQQNIDSNFAG